jgi:hypothetical protein
MAHLPTIVFDASIIGVQGRFRFWLDIEQVARYQCCLWPRRVPWEFVP